MFTDAIALLDVPHDPDGVISDNVVVPPTQTLDVPPMAATTGAAFTVMAFVRAIEPQALLIV